MDEPRHDFDEDDPEEDARLRAEAAKFLGFRHALANNWNTAQAEDARVWEAAWESLQKDEQGRVVGSETGALEGARGAGTGGRFLRMAAGVVLALLALLAGGSAVALLSDWGRDVLSRTRHEIQRWVDGERTGPVGKPTVASALPTETRTGSASRGAVSNAHQSEAGGPAAPVTPPLGPCVFAFGNDGKVYAIDPVSRQLAADPVRITSSSIQYHRAALTKDGLFVVTIDYEQAAAFVQIVETDTGAVNARVALETGARPESIVLSADERTAYVLKWDDGPQVVVISFGSAPQITHTVNLQRYEKAERGIALHPEGMVLDPSGRYLYVLVGRFVRQGRSPLQVVDLKQGTAKEVSIPGYGLRLYRLFAGPGAVEERLLVSQSGVLLNFDPPSVVGTFQEVGDFVAVSRSRDELYTADRDSEAVRILGLTTLVKESEEMAVPGVQGPLLVADSPDGERLFLATSEEPLSDSHMVAVDLASRRILPGYLKLGRTEIMEMAIGQRCPGPDRNRVAAP